MAITGAKNYWNYKLGKVTACSYRVTFAFQSESTLTHTRCLNVKDLLAQNRHNIRSFSDCKGIGTDIHLVRKQTLNHLGKLVKLT